MKRLLNILFVIFVLCTSFLSLYSLNFNHSYAFVTEVRVIYNKANIYTREDILSLNPDEMENYIIKTAKIDDVFVVLDELTDTYKIQVEQNEGYILKSMVINNIASSPVKKLNYNAVLICNADIYEKTSEQFKKTDKQINEGTKVCIVNGYDQKQEYTLVTFYSNNSIINGYIKTEALKVDGVNGHIFIYISVIIAVVTIIITMYKIFSAKKKSRV